MERIEWQLDQIRAHTQIVALASLLIMLAVAAAALLS